MRAALGLLDAIVALNVWLAREQSIAPVTALAVRVGIHTGPVVVGEIGGGPRREQLALGETPNLAARLQGLAPRGGAVISGATERLVQGYFHTAPLGPQSLKGFAEPLPVWRVLSESGADHRLDLASALTPLVGRGDEIALLLSRWQRTRADGIQTVVLSREPGIGKTRLTRVLRERLEAAGESVTRIELRGAQLHQHSALFPLIQHYQRLLGVEPEEPPDATVQKLEGALAAAGVPLAEAAPLLAALLSLPLPERYPASNLSPEQQKQQTLEVSLRWLLAEARRGPVLFVVEDLHWLDPSTLELVSLLIERQPPAPILLLLTCRPEFAVPWPLGETVTLLSLGRLGRGPAAEVVREVAGSRELPAAVADQIARTATGCPCSWRS